MKEFGSETKREKISDDLKEGGVDDADSRVTNKNQGEILDDEEEPIFDEIEVPGIEENGNSDSETQGSVWPDKVVDITQYVSQKSLGAMPIVLRHISGKSDDGQEAADEDKNFYKGNKDSVPENAIEKVSQKSGWKPLRFLGISHASGGENKFEQEHTLEDLIQPGSMKGRIILYTKLGCQECKDIRRYLQSMGLKYVEINIDVFPSRKLELEKIVGSSAFPRMFFNEILIGGLSELKSLEDSGKLAEKIEYVVTETPSYEAPLPSLYGEDDIFFDQSLNAALDSFDNLFCGAFITNGKMKKDAKGWGMNDRGVFGSGFVFDRGKTLNGVNWENLRAIRDRFRASP